MPISRRLITHVETTPSPVADGSTTPIIHRRLQAKALLPQQHIVDTGYVDAHVIVESEHQFGVDLCGPARVDNRWQARAQEGFAAQHFSLDWERMQATCPAGCTSISWTPAIDNRQTAVIKIKFSLADCTPCPHRAQCSRSQKQYQRRTLTVRPQEPYEALQAARQRQTTAAFRTVYAKRAGIEGTLRVGYGAAVCGGHAILASLALPWPTS